VNRPSDSDITIIAETLPARRPDAAEGALCLFRCARQPPSACCAPPDWCAGSGRNKQVFYEADDKHVRHMLADMLTHSGEAPH